MDHGPHCIRVDRDKRERPIISSRIKMMANVVDNKV